MKHVQQISAVLLAVVLAAMTWYITLAPFWITQSGERDNSVHYSQGVGIWLNYTEHVGDATYDPGNSLWVPAQASAAHSFADQCATDAPFCANAVGELHKQFCQVRSVYCGAAIKFLQAAMSFLSGVAVLIVVWSIVLITTKRRTIVDQYLMQLCIINGLSFLVVAIVWYIFVFRIVIESTYYKDQYNRCIENASGRKCWSIGTCLYLIVAAAILYPALSVLVANCVTYKFRTFQRALRRLHESATVVGLTSPPPVELKATHLRDVDKSMLHVAPSSATFIERSAAAAAATTGATDATNPFPALVPLKSKQQQQPTAAAVRAVNVHEIDVVDSDVEETKLDDADDVDAFASTSPTYRNQVMDATAMSPTSKKKHKKKKAKGKTTTTSGSSGSGSSAMRSTQQRDSL